ncbi:SH3 domain-containing YSC84-like protein 1 isoform 1-T1 [Lycodopsis pacificus]
MSNPIPSNLKSEAKKAAKILRDFTEISNRNGPDKLIPAHVIAKAEGLAIISVIKAGFMITARGGSGIVIARLADRRWSAPSAIGIAGLGGGFEIGVEVSDLVIILNHRRAVEAFTKGGNLTLGGNCTVAVGPMGRNVEADVAIRSPTAVFTYCRSRGLFAGISLEGSGLIERKETNRKFYLRDIRASAILNGDVEPPSECYDLYHILEAYTEAYTTDWTNKNMRPKSSFTPSRPPAPSKRPPTSYQQPPSGYQQPPSGYQQPPSGYQQPPSGYQQPPSGYQQPPSGYQQPPSGYQQPPSGYQQPPSGYQQPPSGYQQPPTGYQQPPTSYQQPPTSTGKNILYPSISVYKSETSDQFASRSSPNAVGGASGQLVVTATHPFSGQQPGDLSFAPGDRITVVTKTDSEYDWWEGRLADGRIGIFPANFVTY